MYFVSCTPHLVVDLDSEQERLADKQPNAPLRQRKIAQFSPAGGVPDYAREAVQRLPGFLVGVGRDEDPFSRMGWWDSVHAQHENGWTDAERERAEQALLASGDPNVLLVERPRLVPPWPSYDGMHHAKVAAFAVEAGCVEQALAYEQENKQRDSVVEALTKAARTGEQPVAEEELVTA